MNSNPLVSVAIVTYNHENYIRQAIESVLMQKTDFDFEIIIGEDGSNDSTSDIVQEYVNGNPKKIRALFHTKNLGFGGRVNSMTTLRACKGKFIAILEGDDFWTDQFKLQKQVDFFNHNPEFAICFHNSKIIFEDDPSKLEYTNPKDQPLVSNLKDLVKGEFIYTATSMFKRDDFLKFRYENINYLNNYTLDLHNAQYGDIKYINEVMSVYRKHSGGTWSMVDREKTLINQLPAYKFYMRYFDKEYRGDFRSHLKNMTAELLSIKIGKGELKNIWKYYLEFALYNTESIKDLRHLISIFVSVSRKKFVKLFENND